MYKQTEVQPHTGISLSNKKEWVLKSDNVTGYIACDSCNEDISLERALSPLRFSAFTLVGRIPCSLSQA